MFFDVALYISLTIFVFGMCYRVSSWFRNNVGPYTITPSTQGRVTAAIKGCFSTILSRKVGSVCKIFITDVVFQSGLLKDGKDKLVWIMHMCIYGGFMLLLLMHALDRFITVRLFADYQPTLNPFLFLRNAFGVILMIGLILAVIRRTFQKSPRINNRPMDLYAILILAIIAISGFLLEGTKINSYSVYEAMVEDYAYLETNEEAQALEAYWVREFGVVSPHEAKITDEKILSLGKDLHDASCAACHSKPKWAFVSYTVAKTIGPFAIHLDRTSFSTIVWYVHFLACFFGLAYLPFSKMFHIFATPISILVNAVIEEGKSEPANIDTKLRIELDGCKHGGTCHSGCPVQERRQAELDTRAQSEPFLGYLQKNLRISKK